MMLAELCLMRIASVGHRFRQVVQPVHLLLSRLTECKYVSDNMLASQCVSH